MNPTSTSVDSIRLPLDFESLQAGAPASYEWLCLCAQFAPGHVPLDLLAQGLTAVFQGANVESTASNNAPQQEGMMSKLMRGFGLAGANNNANAAPKLTQAQILIKQTTPALAAALKQGMDTAAWRALHEAAITAAITTAITAATAATDAAKTTEENASNHTPNNTSDNASNNEAVDDLCWNATCRAALLASLPPEQAHAYWQLAGHVLKEQWSVRGGIPQNTGVWPRLKRWLPHALAWAHAKPAAPEGAGARAGATAGHSADDQLLRSAVLNQIAVYVYFAQNNPTQALPLFEEVLAIAQTVLGEKHPDTATSLNNLAGIYYAQKQYSQALPLFEQALAIRQKTLGKKHPLTQQAASNLDALRKQL